MNLFTIKDIEKLSGVKAHTLRIWEQRYKFLKPSRTGTNIRYYNSDELKAILNIALLNKFGYKISHIDRMSLDEISEKILSLNHFNARQEKLVNDLVGEMLDLRMDNFEAILDNYILERGIERSITQMIFPFLEKIGILWLTNHINPAQEHLISNIIREKLIVGIAGIAPISKLKKSILLFLPEGEFHELGLLFMCYLLKSRGVEVVYLGSNVPLHDVEYVANIKRPDYLYTHITSGGHNFNFDKFLQNLQKRFSKTPVIISGSFTNTYQKKIRQPLFFKHSFTEAMEFVAGL